MQINLPFFSGFLVPRFFPEWMVGREEIPPLVSLPSSSSFMIDFERVEIGMQRFSGLIHCIPSHTSLPTPGSHPIPSPEGEPETHPRRIRNRRNGVHEYHEVSGGDTLLHSYFYSITPVGTLHTFHELITQPPDLTQSVPPIVPDGILVFIVVFVPHEITSILYLSL